MTRVTDMSMTLSPAPLVLLIAGILIPVVPSLLNFIVAIYLIVIGLIGGVRHGRFPYPIGAGAAGEICMNPECSYSLIR